MNILFATAELTPLAKVGGLADVAGALPKALKKLGVDIRIVLPKYGIIDEKKYPSELIAKDISVTVGQNQELINIYQTTLPNSKVIVYLIDNQKYLGENGIYFEKTAFCGSFAEIKRFLFFSSAVLKLPETIDWQPEIIHCQDWHTAIISLLLKLKTKNQKPKTLLTIHNLANQGKWNAQEILDFLKLDVSSENQEINIFKQGILLADLINTVSPTYAQEILTPKYGEGLEKILQKRKKDLSGILNGLDIERFNPRTDPNIYQNYSAETIERKLENKLALQKELNLEVNRDTPLFGLISRLTEQKGIDLILEIIDQIVALGGQMIFLGTGLDKYENGLKKAAEKYPKQISSHLKFDALLAQKIYAASDIFLMPSRFEPCGLGQLIAMRYGTIPIVRETGGLKDTVRPQKKILFWQNQGTGFVFKKTNSQELLKTIKQALNFFKNRQEWRKLQIRVMQQDFSWQKSARKYLQLYQQLKNL